MAQAAAEKEANIIYEPASPIEQKKYFEAEAAKEELEEAQKKANEATDGNILSRIRNVLSPTSLEPLKETAQTAMEDAVKVVEPKVMEPLTFNPLYIVNSLVHRRPTIHRRLVFAGFDVREESRFFGRVTKRVVYKGYREVPPWEKIE